MTATIHNLHARRCLKEHRRIIAQAEAEERHEHEPELIDHGNPWAKFWFDTWVAWTKAWRVW